MQVTWYDTKRRPPMLAELGLEKWHNGVLFVGERGRVIGDYTKNAIGPAASFADFEPPAPTIPDSVGHYKEWVQACLSREPTSCGFDDSGPLSETVLLGNVSFRLGGVPLDWDAERMTAPGVPATLLRRQYRDGWTL